MTKKSLYAHKINDISKNTTPIFLTFNPSFHLKSHQIHMPEYNHCLFQKSKKDEEQKRAK